MSQPPHVLSVELLGSFEQALERSGAAVAQAWRPGVTPEALDDAERRLGLKLSDEARRWWSWHDGVADAYSLDARQQLGAFWTPLSLAGAVERTLYLRDFYDRLDIDYAGSNWDRSWIVLCASQDAHIAVACDASVAVTSSAVHYFDPEANPEPAGAIVGSIDEVVRFWLEVIQDGTWRVIDGCFEQANPVEFHEEWMAQGRPAELEYLL